MSGKVVSVPPSPAEEPVKDESTADEPMLHAQLARLEAKIDAIGTGQQWIMSTVNNAMQGLLASPMGAMIKNKMGGK